MESKFYVSQYWKHNGSPYHPVTNHKILKNVLVESEHSEDRYGLMLDLLEQMEERLPPFSALYINLNPRVECPETFDANIPYGSPRFSVPYYFKCGDRRLYDAFNKCFTSIFNFHTVLRTIMGIIYQDCEEKGFPTSIVGFLDLMSATLLDQPYAAEFNESLLKNISDARDLFENDSTLEKTLRIRSTTPEWVDLWKKNQKIWIDLSSCEPRIQNLLIPIVFLTLLRCTDHYGPKERYWHLQGVVMINEADSVFASVPWERYNARYNQRREYWSYVAERDYFLTKEQMIEAYGDPFYFLKGQLESYYHRLLLDDLRFRKLHQLL